MAGARLSFLSLVARKPWYFMWRFMGARLYSGREYTLQVPYGRRVLTPWFVQNGDSEFSALLETVRGGGDIKLTPDRAYLLVQFVKRALTLPGNIAECGVHKGASSHLIAAVLSQHGAEGAELHLFDSFEGMPSFADPERDYHKPGDYSDTSLDGVKSRLSEYLDRCRFFPGIIPDSFGQVTGDPSYSLVNVDVDLYPTNLDCCEWFWPRLVTGGMMVFNDYGFYPYRHSTRKAVDEFFAGRVDRPIILPSGQAIVIKTR